MIIKQLLSALLISSISFAGVAQERPGKTVNGRRTYRLVVNEGTDSTIAEFNRGLEGMRGNDRSVLGNIVGLYKNTAAGHAVGITTGLIDLGVSTLINATRSRQPDWQKAVQGECTFVRRLPMQMEILDFYRRPSYTGPLDPKDMNFNGFGCRQVIEFTDTAGNIHEEEVFYLSCKVRMDDAGKARMLNHSKFEVLVDSLRFNYALCDLPNDSLSVDADTRIGFSFEKRRDLKFIVNASITSSWINQAMMVFNDQPLGQFDIVASIDPQKIDPDGVFRYSAADKGSGKMVSVSGDCFLVPRSYVGTSNIVDNRDSWGTGQYKVEMRVSETCKINEDYYRKDGKWDSAKWKPEWQMIKRRRHSPSGAQKALGVLASQYADSKWVTVLTEPVKTVFIQYEKDGITKLMNPGTSAPAKSPSR